MIVGKPIGLILAIEGIDKDFINLGEDYEIKSKGEFIYTFAVIPEKKGKLILGPYSNRFQWQKLTSNSLVLEVSAIQKEGEIRVVYPNGAKTNEVVIIELIAQEDFLKTIKVVKSPNYSVKSSTTSSSQSTIEGKITNNYIARFKFTFNKSGVYKIDESMFEGIPEGLKIKGEEISID